MNKNPNVALPHINPTQGRHKKIHHLGVELSPLMLNGRKKQDWKKVEKGEKKVKNKKDIVCMIRLFIVVKNPTTPNQIFLQ